ncbi:transcriptional regulator [Pedobacter psychrophilus]|uniref:Transcriptional regulator n=1 Tax=Pedobacter psychrophilus TaxID=1826909 RepID=A0A179DHV3_9SPHI|nr:helix-turn-helix transcriptional regulator [Pedobacter psychrophilus]OAQ40528.1 transcriptional regulator [Pedobacter psychrophilus]
MNIGSAIKSIRKERGFSQKDFAIECGLSVNALCQIEINSSFPQKNTIKLICEKLNIPVSYLLFFSINDEDIPEDKRKTFNSLNTAIKEILLDDIDKSYTNI